MGFETPLALLGMAAAALPFLIHRIRQRRLPTLRLPSILLLQRAQAEESRRYRVTDRLLLALRVGILAALCAALAAPYWSVPSVHGDGRLASVAIVLDDSLSMQQNAQGKPYWEHARRYARSLVRALPEGSEVAIVLAGSPPRVWQARTPHLRNVERRLQGTRFASHRGTSLPAAVRSATRQLAGSSLAEQRLYVLSDRARHARLEDVPWPSASIQVAMPRFAPEDEVPENLAVTDVQVTTRYLGGDEVEAKARATSLAVRVEIRRFGAAPHETKLRLRRGDHVLASENVALRADATQAVLTPPPLSEDEGGDAAHAWVELVSGDDFPFDDRRAVWLQPPKALRVLLVNGAPDATRDQDELRYATSALRLAPANQGRMELRVIDAATLSSADLADVDVAVLANMRAPDTALVKRLRRFVEAGGGLLITAGEHVDPTQYNTHLASLLPAPIQARSTEGRGAQGLRVDADAFPWPAGASGLAESKIQGRLLLDLDRASHSARFPIRFEDGLPMLAIDRVGKGRSALWTTSLDDDWGDLPYRPGYLPLLVELTHHLSQAPQPPAQAVSPGMEAPLALPPGWERAEVVDPEGRRHPVESPAHTPARFEETLDPGPYAVWAAAEHGPWRAVPRAHFVVAPPPEESDLRRNAEPLPEQVQAEREAAATTASSRQSAVPWLLWLAGWLAAAEGAWRIRRAHARRASTTRSIPA